jgi:hydroxymethylpyrimidine/phosphomethylpyrimidine kinase
MEARILAAAVPPVDDNAVALAEAVRAFGPAAVVVTGGHREEATDVFCGPGGVVDIPGERYAEGAAHGSGCTHSSALAAYLAHGFEPLEAARRAKVVASDAVRNGLRDVGRGPGPVDALGLSGDRGPDRTSGFRGSSGRLT